MNYSLHFVPDNGTIKSKEQQCDGHELFFSHKLEPIPKIPTFDEKSIPIRVIRSPIDLTIQRSEKSENKIDGCP